MKRNTRKKSPRPSQKKQTRLRGVIDVTRSGKGFLLQEEGDILIPREELNSALSGDIVEVVVRDSRRGMIGRVVDVLERKRNSFVGEIVKAPEGFLLAPSDPRVHMNFRIVGASGAPVGHKALIDVIEWNSTPPKAKIRSVFGVSGEHETEMQAIPASKGFDTSFPPHVLEAAKNIHATYVLSPEGRRDFRTTETFTIDPDTAKDFDDAISYRMLEGGSEEIGIHIADVTHFVTPGSPLDREAEKRGTSVYLVDRTIPMLPKELSEDLCSLKPAVDRLTFSAVFTVKRTGKGYTVLDRWFGRTIIHSKKRFTYDEADNALTTEDAPHHGALKSLWAFASYLRKERSKEGALMFNLDEVKPIVDESGTVVSFKRSRYTESHQLIEELMLMANREVASVVSRTLGKKNRLFVYRVHDVPNAEKLDELAVFLRAIGYDLATSKQSPSQKDLNRILSEAKGKPEERLITTVTIRSMAKAVYATQNVGHYGLAFNDYAHFTSPIRRYPDMMVHRTLATILAGKKIAEKPEAIHARAVHASAQEVGAAEAERESVKLKQVEYMAGKIGEERDGVISGVADWGIYIEDAETGAEGMMRLTELTDDTYEHDQKKFAAVGKNSKTMFRMGDPIRFRVEAANIEEKTLDYRILKTPE